MSKISTKGYTDIQLIASEKPKIGNIKKGLSDLVKNIIFIDLKEKSESQMSPLEKMQKLRSGLSKLDLERFKSRTELDYDELSQVLAVTRATLIKKKGSEKFNFSISERLIGLVDIYSFGFEVFEDESKFKKWMFRPNQALAGKTPFEVSDNQFGREEVKNLIGRVEFGVYS
jgi:putative toxin-antitoxin system antitoxin component (TIGR02293 family)